MLRQTLRRRYASPSVSTSYCKNDKLLSTVNIYNPNTKNIFCASHEENKADGWTLVYKFVYEETSDESRLPVRPINPIE